MDRSDKQEGGYLDGADGVDGEARVFGGGVGLGVEGVRGWGGR